MIYKWIWNKLPGGRLKKLAVSAALAVLAVWLLISFVYPNLSLFLNSDPTVAD